MSNPFGKVNKMTRSEIALKYSNDDPNGEFADESIVSDSKITISKEATPKRQVSD